MKWTPRPDQEPVLEFLMQRQRAALFAATGAGKTVLASSWAVDAMADRFALPRLLIVAPKLVAQHGWPAEVHKWDHLAPLRDMRVLTSLDFGLSRVAPGIGGAVATSLAQVLEKHTLGFRDKRATKLHLLGLRERVHVIAWDFWPWLVRALGANWCYQGIIFDESSFLRDPSSARTSAARHTVHRPGGVVDHVLLLSGTPAHNHGEALYPQIDLVAPGLLGRNLTAYRETWCLPDASNWKTGQVYSWKTHPALQQKLNALVATIAVSVPSSLTVPLIEVDQGVSLGDHAQAAYGAMERDWVWGGVAAGSEAVLHSKLRQIASGFLYPGEDDRDPIWLHDAKTEKLVDLVESIDGQVIVGFEFTEELRRIKGAFGKQVRDIREPGALAAFKAGKCKVLAVHPQSAAHGVDGLQDVCCQVIWTTVPQDAELAVQLVGRVHRHGTKAATVYAHYIVALGTVEERIRQQSVPAKLAQAEAFLDGIKMAA